ncbi:hypothetical protein BABINDRAFT_31611 [Babjeviella inositovora NRRL Y-12698]|uniref:CoA-binding domain-containing protein n=1 Tax=Babjeviella inositovora NRRL Y-12698 TaxID=984486 RepID=A0A1E3QZE4_9ASCO|nr:uncharacterized protein BABINDRAFT_31611 [Babjeviella inositovora NRRL Y-12698]ODQ83008.1 hypothetical protein BABINDRAFT_31611 [Babjeviella inositovora NRRL Y-12698]
MSLNIQKVQKFFASYPTTTFLVVGALSDESKFGFKVLKWYLSHDLTVVPINPKSKTIADVPVSANVSAAIRLALGSSDAGIALSFITPPAVTLNTLKELGRHEGYQQWLRGVWFQPGSFDLSVLDYTDELGVYDRVVENGDCILVVGEQGLQSQRSPTPNL